MLVSVTDSCVFRKKPARQGCKYRLYTPPTHYLDVHDISTHDNLGCLRCTVFRPNPRRALRKETHMTSMGVEGTRLRSAVKMFNVQRPKKWCAKHS